MKIYNVFKKVCFDVIFDGESNYYIFAPEDKVQVVVEGNTIFIKHGNKLYETNNMVSTITYYLQDGSLHERISNPQSLPDGVGQDWVT